jgi:NRPS condensation-like uncharacterized protein
VNRLLSEGEHLLWLIDRAVPQNFVMVARLSGLLDETVLRQALDHLQPRYPVLKCKIKHGPAPAFVTGAVPRIPLRTIRRKGEDHWIKETENEMLVPLPWTKGPLVRVMQLGSKDKAELLVTLCHITADATSGVKFVKNLLRIAGMLSQGKTPIPEPPLPELPALVDLLRDELKQEAGFFTAGKSQGQESLQAVELQGDKPVSPEKRITRIIQRTLSKGETKTLMIRSRKEKATVHTSICAALMQTMVEEIRNTQTVPQQGPLLIGCITPVNVRPLLKLPVEEDLGNFISNALHYQLIDDTSSLWEAARETRKSLQEDLETRKDIGRLLSAGKFLEPDLEPAELVSRLKDLFPPSGVTNMGQLDIPEHFGNLILEDLHYHPSINPLVKNGFALSVSGFRSHTTLNFLYAEPYISGERANRMVERTMKRLIEAVG